MCIIHVSTEDTTSNTYRSILVSRVDQRSTVLVGELLIQNSASENSSALSRLSAPSWEGKMPKVSLETGAARGAEVSDAAFPGSAGPVAEGAQGLCWALSSSPSCT